MGPHNLVRESGLAEGRRVGEWARIISFLRGLFVADQYDRVVGIVGPLARAIAVGGANS